jgi:hypothetical protein
MAPVRCVLSSLRKWWIIFSWCVLCQEVWFQVLTSCGWQHWTLTPDDKLAESWTRSCKVSPRPAGDASTRWWSWCYGLFGCDGTVVFRNKSVTSSVLVDRFWLEQLGMTAGGMDIAIILPSTKRSHVEIHTRIVGRNLYPYPYLSGFGQISGTRRV